MNQHRLAFVSLRATGGGFAAVISMDSALSGDKDLQSLLRRAAAVYEQSVKGMRCLIEKIDEDRRSRRRVTARTIWEVGDLIFKLTSRLAKVSLQLDSVYSHLMRDLGVKRMWLEKVIIFRRYVPRKTLIPKDLRWGRCSRTPRKAANLLLNGKMPE